MDNPVSGTRHASNGQHRHEPVQPIEILTDEVRVAASPEHEGPYANGVVGAWLQRGTRRRDRSILPERRRDRAWL